MPVTRTAKRALRRSKRKQIINVQRKNVMRTALKNFRLTPSAKTLQLLVSTVDKCAKWGLIHANKAAHLKSQMTKRLAVK